MRYHDIEVLCSVFKVNILTSLCAIVRIFVFNFTVFFCCQSFDRFYYLHIELCLNRLLVFEKWGSPYQLPEVTYLYWLSIFMH